MFLSNLASARRIFFASFHKPMNTFLHDFVHFVMLGQILLPIKKQEGMFFYVQKNPFCHFFLFGHQLAGGSYLFCIGLLKVYINTQKIIILAQPEKIFFFGYPFKGGHAFFVIFK